MFFLLYNSYAQTLQASILANVNLKTKITIYKKVINELSIRFEGAEEFTQNRLKELCSEHGISAEEVRLYTFSCYVYSLATYTV